jgi:hypothetical protein
MQTKKRGRPPSAESLASSAVNYESLAWQVKQRIERAAQNGGKLKIRDAVIAEMRASVEYENTHGRPMRVSRVDAKLATAYTEVRKILKKWAG